MTQGPRNVPVVVLVIALLGGCSHAVSTNQVPKQTSKQTSDQTSDQISLPQGRGDRAIAALFVDTLDAGSTPNRTFEMQKPGQREAVLAELARRRGIWKATGISSYRFLFFESCFCPVNVTGWQLIEVQGGVVTRAWDPAGRALPLAQRQHLTIDGLLDDNLSRASYVELRFDSARGFPTWIRVNPQPAVPDSWWFVKIRSLRLLTAP